MTRRLFFITHADVAIDPAVPGPDWPLNARGRARHAAHARRWAALGPPVSALWSSAERKARDGANILGSALGIAPQVEPELGENDRSATGYLPEAAFRVMMARFFAEPDARVAGWEAARAAQSRVVRALDRVGRTGRGHVVVVAHGGVGALLHAHAARGEISAGFGQPGRTGGNMLEVRLPDLALLAPWRDIDVVPA